MGQPATPVGESNVLRALKVARAFLEDRAWIKGAFASTSTDSLTFDKAMELSDSNQGSIIGTCTFLALAVGARSAAMEPLRVAASAEVRDHPLWRAFCAAAGLDPDKADICDYNNAAGRTKEQVLETFDKAIAAAGA